MGARKRRLDLRKYARILPVRILPWEVKVGDRILFENTYMILPGDNRLITETHEVVSINILGVDRAEGNPERKVFQFSCRDGWWFQAPGKSKSLVKAVLVPLVEEGWNIRDITLDKPARAESRDIRQRGKRRV